MLPQKSMENVAVSFSDMLPLLVDAIRNERGWLEDFADDVVHVPQDLYEVLLAYRSMIEQDAA